MTPLAVLSALMQKPYGFFLIDKPSDWTSFDVCARVRKHMNMKKVGHTGTLDPFATGLLVVAIGKATKLIPFLEKAKKTYIATIQLGETTVTLDPESDVKPAPLTNVPSLEEIQSVLKTQFTGPFEQIPPQFSAIKIKGKRAYAMARKGDSVDLPPRPVIVHTIKVLEYAYPKLVLEMQVGAGFYVRSLARDIGKAFGGSGYCTQLRRTAVDEISIDDADLLSEITTPIDPKYIPLKLEQRELAAERLADFWEGRAFPFQGTDGEKYLILQNGKSIGIGEMVHGKLQPRQVF